jgi:ParB/RepB/Spo0J family partition protein
MAKKLEAVLKRKDLHVLNPKRIVVRKGWNPREQFDTPDDDELLQFVKDNGPIFPPIFVKRVSDNVELIDGERRLRAVLAAIEAGCEIEGISAIFVGKNANEITQLSLALTANQGKPLTPMEEASACQRLLNWGLSEAEIARRLGKSRAHVANRLVLADASPAVANAVEEGTITQGEAIETVKESEGSIEKQDEKLERIKKPVARRAPKMMSRLNLQKNLEAMSNEVTEAEDLNGSIGALDQLQKKYCTLIGMTMVLKNIEFDEAESEVFIAINDKLAVEAVKEGRAPWEG